MQRRTFIKLAGGALAALAAEAVRPRAAEALAEVAPTISRHVRYHDQAGHTYEIEPAAHRVSRVAPDGRVLWRIGGDPVADLNFPVAMAEDAQGRLYVLEKGAARIQVLDAAGTRLGAFAAGTRGAGAPSDLAIDGWDRIFVCQPSQHRVLVLDLAGHALGEIGAGGRGRDGLNGPRSLAFDAEGHLHVLDAGHRRVVVFDASGLALRTYGETEAFSAPSMIRADERGRMVVADPARGCLHVYTSGGKPLASWRPVLADGRPAAPVRLSRGARAGLAIAVSPTV